jgi:hypothetical protein
MEGGVVDAWCKGKRLVSQLFGFRGGEGVGTVHGRDGSQWVVGLVLRSEERTPYGHPRRMDIHRVVRSGVGVQLDNKVIHWSAPVVRQRWRWCGVAIYGSGY